MIELDIKQYCHECPNFRPTVETIFSNNSPAYQVVVCDNHLVCDNIEFHLRKEIQKENEK